MNLEEYFLLKQLEDFDKMELNTEIYDVQECWMQRRQDDTSYLITEVL